MNPDLDVLKSYIRDVIGYDGAIAPDTDLIEQKILDSFNVVEMALFIQERFRIELDADDLVRSNLSRLSDMLALIARKREAAPAGGATVSQ